MLLKQDVGHSVQQDHILGLNLKAQLKLLLRELLYINEFNTLSV